MSENKKPPPLLFPRLPPPPEPSSTYCNYCNEEVDDISGRVRRVKRLNGDDYVWHYRCYEEAITEAIIRIYKEEEEEADQTS